MPSLKDVQNKIFAVKKTKQITKAMNMVATSRLRGAQANMQNFRPYAAKFSEVLGSLAEKSGDEASPLLMPREEVKKIHIVLCTSDRGLCGGFNVNLIDKANSFVKENAGGDTAISFTNFGRRGLDWCRKEKYNITDEHIGVVGTTFSFSVSATTGRKLIDGYLNGDYDEVYVIFSSLLVWAGRHPRLNSSFRYRPSRLPRMQQQMTAGNIRLSIFVNPPPIVF